MTDVRFVDDLVLDGLVERFDGRPVHICIDGDLDAEMLTMRSQRIAATLAEAGVGRGHIVVIKGRRDSWLLPTLLGILAVGAAYAVVPYNSPAAVEDRLLDTIAPSAMVVWDDLAPHAWAARSCAQLTDNVRILTAAVAPAGSSPRVLDDAAYVIATSGTSGSPKAVLVPHRAVLAFLDAAVEIVETTEDDVVAARSSAAFDLSVWELFASAITGATAVLVVEKVAADTAKLHELLSETGATVLSTTPSAAYQLGAHDESVGGGLALKRLLVGGEASDGGRLADVLAAPSFEDTRLDNWYGPTEVTVSCTGGELTSDDLLGSETPIGPPLPGVDAVVLSSEDSATAGGELAVGGDQLAHGYLGDPRATAQAFVPDPNGDGSRLYLTGDIVSTDDQGRFVYQGRGDSQVQLRGYRLELSEVERTLAAYGPIRWCHVLVGGTDDDVLIAYFASVGDQPIDRAALWSELFGRLPRHAVPAALVHIDEVPVTVGEKLNFADLPDPVVADFYVGETVGTAARSDTERRLLVLWRQLLELDEVGTNHHFFALGGHSLLVARMVNGIAREFGVRLQLADVIDGLTVSEIATVIEEKIEHRPVGVAAPTEEQDEMSW